MKLSWGTIIVIVYTVFVIGTLTMVYIFMNQDVSLVTENYYAEEIKYQNQIEKKKNSESLDKNISVIMNEGYVDIVFPEITQPEKIKGEIEFYRPSDQERDFIADIQLDSTYTFRVPFNKLKRGYWKIKIDWSDGIKEYYYEKNLMIS
ncbi:cbb3-type cytochrome c oxidase maturation protein CcoH [Melioribacter roseus P3M-2]|uniref:Cbb3-type cytochrome c oxidase maturation protein CcoH n=1 Tax=Melioribacter roseus (strain DSM 23840 / JCM 17771 / VKM B-2668 / P3M-2) TaxID=1191523 RepID=I6ZRR4_MELRP|nr:FixH family protein [Melioribacter roseus]AFN74754.1 cbb3-type cytochrome c oxidase maturation protein CcoH [Melioribacter roseus P3M-2]